MARVRPTYARAIRLLREKLDLTSNDLLHRVGRLYAPDNWQPLGELAALVLVAELWGKASYEVAQDVLRAEAQASAARPPDPHP